MSLLLYGIVADGSVKEAPDAQLIFLSGGGLMAVAKPCDNANREVESVLAFGKVIESIHLQTTIIPIRFGTLLPDATTVSSHLEAMRDEYRHRLAELEGCEEMGIRLPMTKPTTSLAPPQPTTSGRRYLQSLKDKYSATVQAERQAETLNLLLAGLYRKHHAEAGWFNGESMYLLSYLVPRDKLNAFREKLNEASKGVDWQGLISGPWPPYNFA